MILKELIVAIGEKRAQSGKVPGWLWGVGIAHAAATAVLIAFAWKVVYEALKMLSLRDPAS